MADTSGDPAEEPAGTDTEAATVPDTEWLRLLDGMRAHVPDLTSRFVAEMTERALYDPELVPADDIAQSARETMVMLIDRLDDTPTPRADFAQTLGRRRARQGVPLELLVEAIRMDLRIVWQMLRELTGAGTTDVLVRNVERLMDAVDSYVGDVQEEYLRELAILHRDSRLATEQHLSKLFNARELTPGLLETIAEGIGVPASARFEVLLVADSDEGRRDREVDAWLAKPRVYAYMFRGWLVLFRAAGTDHSSWPQVFGHVPAIHIGAVDGLDRVPEAARTGLELQAEAPGPERLIRVEEYWAIGAVSSLQSLLPDFVGSLVTALTELAADDEARVLDTARRFLTLGSVKETALTVGCHRNTVVNRLRLFREATGLDITVPAHASLAYLLLARVGDGDREWRGVLPGRLPH
ncbi:helix-turn-helix domain-containing protein [Brevibacterium litoralis]|uniref:helix-turn-helix domain-containing protein n=1 Tax=Brevibacterium litoralis TaxID=3138935 RepID=UPI0032EF4F00